MSSFREFLGESMLFRGGVEHSHPHNGEKTDNGKTVTSKHSRWLRTLEIDVPPVTGGGIRVQRGDSVSDKHSQQ